MFRYSVIEFLSQLSRSGRIAYCRPRCARRALRVARGSLFEGRAFAQPRGGRPYRCGPRAGFRCRRFRLLLAESLGGQFAVLDSRMPQRDELRRGLWRYHRSSIQVRLARDGLANRNYLLWADFTDSRCSFAAPRTQPRSRCVDSAALHSRTQAGRS